MLSLILAICCGALFYIIIRMSKGIVRYSTSMLACNYAVCVIVGLVTILIEGSPVNHPGLCFAIPFGCLCGFFYVSSLMLIDMSMVRNGIVLTALFARLGLLIPLFASLFFFGEDLTTWQSIGILLALGAIFLMHAGKDLRGFRLKPSLIFLLIVNGSTNTLLKVYEVYGEPVLSNCFLCINFLVACVLVVFLAWQRRESLDLKSFLYGASLGLVNFHTSKFFLMALATVPGSVAYPVQSICIIILVALTGLIGFHEKLSTNQWIGGLICCVAIAMLNL